MKLIMCTFSTSERQKVVRCWCVFVHFDLEMCFVPQRCALFRPLNFQKCSEREVFLPFLLRNVLRATTACNFSSLIWPDVSPAALASLLFDPPEPQIIGKTQRIATFLPFREPASSFSDLIFSLLGFSSLTLPTSTFPFVHIVGRFTSKLPSIISNTFLSAFHTCEFQQSLVCFRISLISTRLS